MMSKSYKLLLPIFLLIIQFCLFPSTLKLCAQSKASKISELVTKTYEWQEFNGSILVAENGKVIYKEAFGYANMEWKIPNLSKSKFRLGSMTKQFTAMLIMQLVEEGEIDLDGKLTNYLPDYRKDTGDKVTIHHILTHTSGIPLFTSLPGFKSDSIRIAYPQDYMVYHYLSGDLLFEPGSKYNYSNAYYLLAVIVEKITGKSYLENLQERIFKPLGMTGSGMEINNEIIDNLTSGYTKDLGGYKKEQYMYMPNGLGDGNLYSTVEDMFLWDQALYTEQLLSEKYKEIMFTPFLNNYAYGWRIDKLDLKEPPESKNIIYHTGSLFGFGGIIIRFVEDRHLIVVLLNNLGSIRRSVTRGVCREIANILYNRPYQLPKKSIAEVLVETLSRQDMGITVKQYHQLKQNKQSEYLFEEQELNRLGYYLLEINKISEAIEIFKLNVLEYPDSSNPYDSLGKAYMIDGQNELAIKNYEKSLELDPNNSNAIKILEKLKSQN